MKGDDDDDGKDDDDDNDDEGKDDDDDVIDVSAGNEGDCITGNDELESDGNFELLEMFLRQ